MLIKVWYITTKQEQLNILKYRTKKIGNTPNNGNRLNADVVFPLKYLRNFWRSLNLQ